MEFKFIDTEISLKYQDIYLKARKKRKEKLCFTGKDKKYRFTLRDSYFDTITDTDVLLQYCLYPLYMKGYTEIKDEVQAIVKEMASSINVIEIYQVFSLIMSQEIKESTYSNIPFKIDFKEIIEKLLNRKNQLKVDMQNYKDNGFDRFGQSIWNYIETICENSTVIKEFEKL